SIKKVITSGVGVREGVYLGDLLRNSKDKFPHNYNTSLRYMIDSNIPQTTFSNQIAQLSKKLFDLTAGYLGLDKKYRYDLVIASKLYPVGSNIHYFSQNRHTYYLVKSSLEYGFTHSQIMLIATLTRYATNKSPSHKHLKKYASLLPDTTTIYALNYLISISIALLAHKPRNINFDLSFSRGEIRVKTTSKLYLAKEAVKKIASIDGIKIKF
ncbi:MAG: Ppx/GppA family phosphatase, partial [Sulfurimonas sp.]|nr:Ppx/GppA family phosphatase [Sulfurimonas sp.]